METLGRVVDAVFVYLIDQVQALDDFAVEETEQLSRLFKNLQQGVEEEIRDVAHIDDYIPHWRKFAIITNFFNMSMVGIVEMWENQELGQFTANEIHKWITALFSDSAFRQKNLSKIK